MNFESSSHHPVRCEIGVYFIPYLPLQHVWLWKGVWSNLPFCVVALYGKFIGRRCTWFVKKTIRRKDWASFTSLPVSPWCRSNTNHKEFHLFFVFAQQTLSHVELCIFFTVSGFQQLVLFFPPVSGMAASLPEIIWLLLKSNSLAAHHTSL